MNGPLEVLMDLARRRSDDAAKALGAQLAARRQLDERGAMLGQYLEHYHARLDAAAREGRDSATLRDLRHFIARIDQALVQQARDAHACAARVAAAQDEWQVAQRRVEAYAALDRRRGARRALAARRQEQRGQDEAAARLHRTRLNREQESTP